MFSTRLSRAAMYDIARCLQEKRGKKKKRKKKGRTTTTTGPFKNDLNSGQVKGSSLDSARCSLSPEGFAIARQHGDNIIS